MVTTVIMRIYYNTYVTKNMNIVAIMFIMGENGILT